MAAWCKARDCDGSLAGNAGSNPAGRQDIEDKYGKGTKRDQERDLRKENPGCGEIFSSHPETSVPAVGYYSAGTWAFPREQHLCSTCIRFHVVDRDRLPSQSVIAAPLCTPGMPNPRHLECPYFRSSCAFVRIFHFRVFSFTFAVFVLLTPCNPRQLTCFSKQGMICNIIRDTSFFSPPVDRIQIRTPQTWDVFLD